MPLRAVTLLLALSLAAAALGCGGDDESAPTTAPELTVPQTDRDETTTTTETAPAPEPPSSTERQDGGTQAPARTQPDSPSNDIPPEPGTPESRFERFCRENPGACG